MRVGPKRKRRKKMKRRKEKMRGKQLDTEVNIHSRYCVSTAGSLRLNRSTAECHVHLSSIVDGDGWVGCTFVHCDVM